MREVAPCAHHVREAPHDLVALVFAEEAEQVADLFERDLAMRRDLTRAIDHSHAAGADRRELFVALLAARHDDANAGRGEARARWRARDPW